MIYILFWGKTLGHTEIYSSDEGRQQKGEKMICILFSRDISLTINT